MRLVFFLYTLRLKDQLFVDCWTRLYCVCLLASVPPNGRPNYIYRRRLRVVWHNTQGDVDYLCWWHPTGSLTSGLVPSTQIPSKIKQTKIERKKKEINNRQKRWNWRPVSCINRCVWYHSCAVDLIPRERSGGTIVSITIQLSSIVNSVKFRRINSINVT